MALCALKCGTVAIVEQHIGEGPCYVSVPAATWDYRAGHPHYQVKGHSIRPVSEYLLPCLHHRSRPETSEGASIRPYESATRYAQASPRGGRPPLGIQEVTTRYVSFVLLAGAPMSEFLGSSGGAEQHRAHALTCACHACFAGSENIVQHPRSTCPANCLHASWQVREYCYRSADKAA